MLTLNNIPLPRFIGNIGLSLTTWWEPKFFGRNFVKKKKYVLIFKFIVMTILKFAQVFVSEVHLKNKSLSK